MRQELYPGFSGVWESSSTFWSAQTQDRNFCCLQWSFWGSHLWSYRWTKDLVRTSSRYRILVEQEWLHLGHHKFWTSCFVALMPQNQKWSFWGRWGHWQLLGKSHTRSRQFLPPSNLRRLGYLTRWWFHHALNLSRGNHYWPLSSSQVKSHQQSW